MDDFMASEERMWLIRQIVDQEEAQSLYDWYAERGMPAMMFRNTFMDDYLVGSYGSEKVHLEANREVPLDTYSDGYVGDERIAECLRLHPLLKMDNVGVRRS